MKHGHELGELKRERDMKRIILAMVAIVLSVNTVFAADIYGSWTTPDRKSIIKISKCGDSICGKITKTAETGMKDIHNPDAAKQSRRYR